MKEDRQPRPRSVNQQLALNLIERWLTVPRSIRWCVPALGMGVLWWSSSQVPSTKLPSTFGVLLHNAMHVVAYACVAAASWLAWSRRPAGAPQPMRSVGAWLLSSVYGVIDELHQAYVPGRHCSFFDVVSDVAGAALAVVLLSGLVGASSRWRRDALIVACVAAVGTLSATFAG